MKKTKQLAVIAVLGLLAFATSNVQAQPLVVTFAGTVLVQKPNTVHSNLTTFTTKTRSVTTKDFLDLIAAATTNTFPIGAKLVYVNGHFEVHSKTNSTLAVVGTSVLDLVVNASGNGVTAGTSNSSTLAHHLTYTGIATLTFSDPAHSFSFTFSGLAVETSSQSAPDHHGKITRTGSGSITGQGDGMFGSSNGVISGRLSVSGSDVILP